MNDPVLVRTHHNYESYADMWRLIELAGFPVVYTDELDPASDNTYIVVVRNGENEAGWPGARARIIHWHMEPHVEYGPWPGVAETWAADRWHAEKIGGRYVPMGSDVRLKAGPDTRHAEYDVAYLVYMIPRRSDVLSGLAQRDVKVSPTSAWGDERHRILTHSTTYLHVHQTDIAPAIPALRMVVAAAYSLPVICETPAKRGIFDFGHMLTSDHAHIAEFVYMWSVKERGAFLQSFGDGLHRLLCHDLTFRRSVEVAL
jgi:hypothetical protein